MFIRLLFDLNRKDLHLMRFFFLIYIIGFFVGTTTHIIDIVNYGLLGYQAPMPFNIYWTSLTIFDPLTIVLLLFKPFWGIILSVLIMVSDISINIYFAVNQYIENGSINIFHLSFQIPFGLFIFITTPFLWKIIKRHN